MGEIIAKCYIRTIAQKTYWYYNKSLHYFYGTGDLSPRMMLDRAGSAQRLKLKRREAETATHFGFNGGKTDGQSVHKVWGG